MAKTFIGNIKGPKGDPGQKGSTGTRGSRWNTGTAITGTSITATAFSTGITDSLVNDMYLNTNTGNTYRCTVEGDESTAQWVYAGNIQGPQGEYAAVDSALNRESSNPVQNKIVTEELEKKLESTSDTQNNTVTFTSADEANPTAWKDVATLASKEKHSSLLKKISTMFSNVRYLYKLLGTTDISALGTVTQALANLDGNVGDIKGIISSLADCSAATVAGYAADALAVKELNSNLNNSYNMLYRNDVLIWSDASQIGWTGIYTIGTIDDTYWSSINKSDLDNCGDYILMILGSNTSSSGSIAYACGFLVSPRWGSKFGYLQVWNGTFKLYKVSTT